jgi:dCTP deaminase
VGVETDKSIYGRRAQERFYIERGREFFLHPGEFVLGSSLEYVRLPKSLSGLVTSRSSWGRMGLVIATATSVGPGYKGVITLELTNMGNTPICLYPGFRIAQIMFYRLETSATGYKGKYDCLIGPEYSNISGDADTNFWQKQT